MPPLTRRRPMTWRATNTNHPLTFPGISGDSAVVQVSQVRAALFGANLAPGKLPLSVAAKIYLRRVSKSGVCFPRFDGMVRLPFGRTCGYHYVADAIRHAKAYSGSHPFGIRVYDEAGNVLETHERDGDFREQ